MKTKLTILKKFSLPYPAGHWFYSLQDLLDNSGLWFVSLPSGGQRLISY